MYSAEDKTKVIMRLKNLRSENKVSCDHAVKRKMYILKQGVAIPKIVKKVWIVESVINIYYLSV